MKAENNVPSSRVSISPPTGKPCANLVILAFVFFRLFDIWKPYPINYVDDKMKGALGILFDDIFAGFYSIIIISLILFFLGG